MTQVDMQLDPKSLVHIMSLLTDLYSDKIGAVTREYLTNALDSHIEAGTQRPIEVTLPREKSLIWTVQDYGVGLSEDDILNTFSMYGLSTKRQSTDVAGMLGLGCKSGLTYTSSFKIEGVKGGILTEAEICKNDHGVGVVKILRSEGTSSPNGVKIFVPVYGEDRYTFVSKTLDVLTFWEPHQVKLVGPNIPALEFLREEKDLLWLDKDVAIGNKIPGARSYLVMGGVRYSFHLVDNRNVQAVAWISPGDVDFPPSREDLQYTEKTNDLISTLSSYVEQKSRRAITQLAEDETVPRFQKEKLLSSYGFGIRTTRFKADGWDLLTNRAKQISFLHANVYHGPSTIITGYPNKTLPKSSRQNLPSPCVVLREGTSLDFLEGRPNVEPWSKFRPEKKVSTSPTPTIYRVTQDETNKSPLVISLEPGEVLVYGGKEEKFPSRYFPEVKYVVLRTNQVNKFKRLYPESISLEKYIADKKSRLLASLPEETKIVLAIGKTFAYAKHNYGNIRDPDLFRLFYLAEHKPNPPSESDKYLLSGQDFSPMIEPILGRYPLLPKYGDLTDEEVWYINAKYKFLSKTIDNHNERKENDDI